MACRTPAADAPSTVALEVSLNAQQFTAAGQTFVTYLRRACRRSRRRALPTGGGTRVVVSGGSFGLPARRGDFRCRFGTAEVVATYLNDTALACTTSVASAPATTRASRSR